MSLIDYHEFELRWLDRAKRNNQTVDMGDRFIALWIAFNGWMKRTFGEGLKDKTLVERVINYPNIENTFDTLKANNEQFAKLLKELSVHTIADMRFITDTNRVVKYDGSFRSLIEAIYQIRCNLFHGRKDPDEDKKDYDLVCLSYDILMLLFETYIEKYLL
jgi:hypothetical protein